ncbi:MAG: DNA-binding response regulator [Actinomycetes bacterium]
MALVLAVSPRANSITREPAFAALGLLSHAVREMLPDASIATEAERVDVIVLDGRADLASARQMCRLLEASGTQTPILLVLGEGGFAAVTPEWGVRDIVLGTAGPGEFDARIRLAANTSPSDGIVSAGGLVIDETAYHASLNGRQLDLTYTEFELLKYLAQAPGRVFTRETLLSDVWGYDYYGGTRTVDVHVRRLRAKLGVENEYLIGTVRNVGYRFNPDAAPRRADTPA